MRNAYILSPLSTLDVPKFGALQNLCFKFYVAVGGEREVVSLSIPQMKMVHDKMIYDICR